MNRVLTTLALIMALTGCARESQVVDETPISASGTIIENSSYRATLTDRDGDGFNDALRIDRKFPRSYGGRGPMIEYFVTSLPRSPEDRNGTVVNVVEPSFFDQYNRLFNPIRNDVISTFGRD